VGYRILIQLEEGCVSGVLYGVCSSGIITKESLFPRRTVLLQVVGAQRVNPPPPPCVGDELSVPLLKQPATGVCPETDEINSLFLLSCYRAS